MKRIFFTLFLILTFCNNGFAESFYFKGCKVNENVSGDYIIDIDNNLINVTLKATDGRVQKFTDKIKLITKDRIVSEIIQQKNNDFSTQYFLDSNSKSVIRQLYKKESSYGVIRPAGEKSYAYCDDVKVNWYKTETEEEKEKEDKKVELLEKELEEKSSLPKCEGNNTKQWSECRGTYSRNEEYKYIGEWKDGKQHGQGIEMWEDGRKYFGEFKNDKRHGQGSFTSPDGTKFSGQYVDGKQHGRGTFIWANGDKYVGEFTNGKQNGKGTYKLADGTLYIGFFKDGKIVNGTLSYPEGEKYVGEFQFNKPHGQGTLTYSNKGKYTGQFIDGYEYGEGICFKPNGYESACTIKDEEIYLGKNKYKIFIIGKWHKIENQSKSRDRLINYFNKQAKEFCSLTGTGNFELLKREIEVNEVDETPAFGLEPKYKLNIDGIVKCK